jgi:hypothetical protein
MIRIAAVRGVLVAGVLAVAAGAAVSDPTVTAHPYFDDAGTLSWSEDVAKAQATARASNRLIFIEYGRKECRNCKVLVQRTLPMPAMKPRFASLCVGLAADCDHPDPRVEALFSRGLPNAQALPFAAFVTADLQWITGWAGGGSPEDVARHLALAEASRPKAPSARPAAPKSPVVAPKPTDPARARPPAVSPPAALAISPTAPSAPVAAPKSPNAIALASADRARALLADAVRASQTADWGRVVVAWNEAERLPARAEPAQWVALLAKADAWAEERLKFAVEAARGGRRAEAVLALSEVRRAMEGRAASLDAAKGEKAVVRLESLGSLAETDRPSAIRVARAEFATGRWFALFS